MAKRAVCCTLALLPIILSLTSARSARADVANIGISTDDTHEGDTFYVTGDGRYDDNFCLDDYIEVGRPESGVVETGILKFDLAFLVGTGATINSVTLKMRCSDAYGGATVALHQVSSSPHASVCELTGEDAHRPTIGSSSMASIFVGTCGLSYEHEWEGGSPGGEYDLVDWVQHVADGGTNHGLAVRTANTSEEVDFLASNYLGGTYGPRLLINFTPGSTDEYACCIGSNCQIRTQVECNIAGGVWLPGVTDCEPNPCLGDQYACCVGYSCAVETLDECQAHGGVWQVGIEDCEGNPCRPQVCCVGQDCEVVTAGDCLAANGEWHEGIYNCSPDPCLEYACCVDEACVLLTEGDCAGAGGYWLVGIASCGPETCEPQHYVLFPDGTGDFETIQAAVDAAPVGSTIELGNGVYTGPGNRAIQLRGKDMTIRSTSGNPEECIIDCEGLSTKGIIVNAGATEATVIEGVQVRNGYVSSGGGGIDVVSASCVLQNIVVRDCEGYVGAGIRIFGGGGTVTIRDAEVSGNQATWLGGGIYCNEASLVLERTVVAHNSAHGDAGLYLDGSLYAYPVTILDCHFAHNTSSSWGSAMEASGGPLTISGSTFEANSSVGPTIWLYLANDLQLEDCVFVDNTCASAHGSVLDGGSIYEPVIRRCTFWGNTAPDGVLNLGTPIPIENTIIAGNPSGLPVVGSEVTLTCSNIYGNTDGDWVGDIAQQAGQAGNISEDPLFCDPAAGDLHLQAGSPCIAYSPPNPNCSRIGALPVGCAGGGVAEVGGVVTASEDGEPIEGAVVTVYPQHLGGTTTTDGYGEWRLFPKAGSQYILEITAPQRMAFREEGVAFEGGHVYEYNTALEPLAYGAFRIVDVAGAPNEAVLEVPEGGIGYMWFLLEGELDGEWFPVPGVEIRGRDASEDPVVCTTGQLAYGFLPAAFQLQGFGLFGVPVQAARIGTGEPDSEEVVTITHVDGLELPLEEQVAFDTRVVGVTHRSEWGYRIYKKAGVGGTVAAATVTGFAGGGSGAVIGLELEGYEEDPPWQEFMVQRFNDMFLQAEAQAGPPRIVDVGILPETETTITFPYGEEYEFDVDALPGLEAVTAFYLFSEPVIMFGPPTTQITANFLSWTVELLIENADSSNFAVTRVADRVGLDIEGNLSAGVSLGVDEIHDLGLDLGASVGAKAHLGGMIKLGVDDEVEQTLYLAAGYEGSAGPRFLWSDDVVEAKLMIPLNFLEQPLLPSDFEIGFDITGTWLGTDWMETRFTGSLKANASILDGYSLPGTHEKYDFWVSVDQQALSVILQATAQLPSQALNIGRAGVDLAIGNESFKQDLVAFLQEVYRQQQIGEPVILPYGYGAAGINEIALDLELEFPLPVFPPLVLAVGGGMTASEVHKYELAEGHFYSGLPLLQHELPSPPTTNLGFMDVIAELWSRVTEGDVWQELSSVIQGHLNNIFFDWDGNDRGIFVISPHGSTLDIEQAAIPAGIDSVYSSYWEWGDGTLRDNRGRSAGDQRVRNYVGSLRKYREGIAGMRYGIGGFYAFHPLGTELLQSAELRIRYLDTEVADIEESQLSVFYEDSTGAWRPIASTANPDSNWVTATISAFRTFTLGPRMPQGDYCFYSDVDSLVADGLSTALLTSEALRNNDDSTIEEGTLFTVTATDGSVLSADADPETEGIQVAVVAGTIQVEYQTGLLPIAVEVAAQSISGSARCATTLHLWDAGAPAAPAIIDLSPYESGFIVRWEENTEEDLAGYCIWFDTDESGPPYDGEGTVWGHDSPIEVGLLDSLAVSELESGVTYYVALTAFDTHGNHSPYSEEVLIAAGVKSGGPNPGVFSLSPNAPNPFNPATVLRYQLPRVSHVRITVYDIQGRQIEVLVDERQDAGRHEVTWDGRDEDGLMVPAGLYLCRAEVGSVSIVRKMLMVR